MITTLLFLIVQCPIDKDPHNVAFCDPFLNMDLSMGP